MNISGIIYYFIRVIVLIHIHCMNATANRITRWLFISDLTVFATSWLISQYDSCLCNNSYTRSQSLRWVHVNFANTHILLQTTESESTGCDTTAKVLRIGDSLHSSRVLCAASFYICTFWYEPRVNIHSTRALRFRIRVIAMGQTIFPKN